MPSLKRGAFVLLVAAAAGLPACEKKISQTQCEELLDHFAELVVNERFPDAGAATLTAERTRERHEAASADEFKNCRSEVQPSEHACAMKAASSDALIKCLE